MTKTFEEYLAGFLDAFDSIDMASEFKRRMAVKPLYDYFQILILEIAVQLCGQNQNSIRPCHLKTRWDMIKNCVKLIEDPTKWDELIYELYNIRSSVEHNDYDIPNETALLRVRKQASEFKDWMLRVGKQYCEESKGFSFIQKYSVLSRWYIGEADWMLHLYGEKVPYSVESDYVPSEEEHPYVRLKSLRDNLDTRIREIDNIDDLKQGDLDNLVDLLKEIERLDAKEDVFLQFNRCPKCGGKIVNTERGVGGSPEDPMPYAVVYRVGCENCDYELNSETIEL